MTTPDVLERFLRYVKIDTQSAPDQDTVPSTKKQFDLARLLEQELNEMGLTDVKVDDHGYVYATLAKNVERDVPKIGWIAHMDTAPDYSGKDVNPQLVEYTGGDLSLSADAVLTVADFPFLDDLQGETLVTTDGTTLLGADNKAGVAAIMSAMKHLLAHPEIPHGDLKIAFTPDEEVGRGADFFDVEGFGADFAYTVDGGPVGEITYESFNAASATVRVRGNSIHPGHAKDVMVNAQIVAMELFQMLPVAQRPEHTENYEGFYLLHHMEGTVEEAELHFIIRDHDRALFEQKKEFLHACATLLNEKYGERVTVETKDTYYNMGEKIAPRMEIVRLAEEAMQEIGLTPFVEPIRGGTDGSRLSFMGLPTPNLFTGGYNYHGKYELIPVSSMEKAVATIVKIAENNTKQK